MSTNRKGVPGEILLLLAAVIWGGAFVAQSLGSDSVSPFTFNCMRSFVGALVLVPVFLYNDRRTGIPAPRGKARRRLIAAGLLCGVFLAAAINLQQIGISFADASQANDKANVGKVGFLTALYIVMVPVLGLFLKRRAGARVWISVGIAVAGMYLLCVKEGFSIGTGDASVILCAFMFSCQILAVDAYAPRVDCVRLSCIQFLVCGVLSGICMLIWEKPSLSSVASAWAPILYTGVLSSGAAYTLQILGQKNCRSAAASLIMSLESVFSALFGFLLLGQTMTAREITGCALMLTAVVLSQLPDRQSAETRR